MEELTAIKTADGREFKPWASVDDVAAIRTDVQDIATSVSDSVDDLAQSYDDLAQSIGHVVMMTDAEKQPALNDLLSQLD